MYLIITFYELFNYINYFFLIITLSIFHYKETFCIESKIPRPFLDYIVKFANQVINISYIFFKFMV